MQQRDLIGEIKALEEEVEGCYKTIRKQGELLTAAVNAMRGPPPWNTLWSHHDVGEMADEFAGALEQIRHVGGTCDYYGALNRARDIATTVLKKWRTPDAN